MAVDLFAGCGGMSRGLMAAGIKIGLAVDNWKPAVAVYRANFGHPIRALDLSKWRAAVKAIKPLKPALIVGGPPCQDFSYVGNQPGLRITEGKRADLTRMFALIVTAVKPEWFVMENVPNVGTSMAYQAARRIFADAGYGLTEMVLKAEDYGVPQYRRRFFCIGRMGDDPQFLEGALLARRGQPRSVREFFADQGYAPDTDHYFEQPRNRRSRGVFSFDEPALTIIGSGRTDGKIPDTYYNPRRRLDSAPTDKARPLRPAERGMIQSFPIEFNWIGKAREIHQMIGNAVPVKLAEAIGRAIMEYVPGKFPPVPRLFN